MLKSGDGAYENAHARKSCNEDECMTSDDSFPYPAPVVLYWTNSVVKLLNLDPYTRNACMLAQNYGQNVDVMIEGCIQLTIETAQDADLLLKLE